MIIKFSFFIPVLSEANGFPYNFYEVLTCVNI